MLVFAPALSPAALAYNAKSSGPDASVRAHFAGLGPARRRNRPVRREPDSPAGDGASAGRDE